MPARGGRAHVVPAFGDDILPPVGCRFSTGEDLALLNGPTTAPPGAVTVNPGTDLSTATYANPAGTTFYLTAGTHTLPGGFGGQVNPLSGNTYIGAPGAILDGQGVNGCAFNGSASNVTIKYLEIKGFQAPVNEFVVNHGPGDGWTFQYCNIHNNAGAAIGLGSNNTISYCWLHHNTQYGFSSYKPPVSDGAGSAVLNAIVDHCEIAYNGDLSDEIRGDGSYTGNGRNGAGKFADTNGITCTNNWIHHANWVGIWADTNNIAALFSGNLFEYNVAEALFYEISYNFMIKDNIFRENSIDKGLAANTQNDSFPTAAIYISESGGDSAVTSTYAVSEITRNRFVDNWSDITFWENADRFGNNGGGNQVYMPKGHGTPPALMAICNDPTPKTITVTLTSGSPNFTVTSGSLVVTDPGRPVSGTGIPAGTTIDPPTNANGFTPGVFTSTTGKLSANATASGSVSMTLAAGSINTTGYSICRWKTQNILVHGNSFDHNQTRVLRGATLNTFVHTGNLSVISNFGTSPSWSPYSGFAVENVIATSQGNVWSNNYYRGTFNFVAKDQSNTITFSEWTSTYSQDAGSTMGGAAP